MITMNNRFKFPIHIDTRANMPVYAQLRHQISWLIASGSLKPGDRLPPIRELSKQLKIHMHTVRQAYHALETDGLVESRPGRGTRILTFDLSKLISSSPNLPSHTIGVLIPNVTPFYSYFLQGLEETASRFNYLLITCFTHDREEQTRQLAQQLISKNVDGLIAVSPVAGVLDENEPIDLPIVYVDAPQFSENVILLDLEGAGYLATHHLISHGHSRIGLITAPLTWQNNQDAFRGYRRALAEARLNFAKELIFEVPGYSLELGYQAARQMLELASPPTAVFASGDILAIGAIAAIKESGRGIPQDIAITSKDNIEFAGLIDPPLTTVASPTYEMGMEAMNMLNRLITGKTVPNDRILFHTDLVIRRSCGCSK